VIFYIKGNVGFLIKLMSTNFIIDDLDPIYQARWRLPDPNYREVNDTHFEDEIDTMLKLLRRSINSKSFRRNFSNSAEPSRNAVFIIQSLDNPHISWAYKHLNRRTYNINVVTPEIVINGLSTLVQSGRPTEEFFNRPRFKFIFAFPPIAREQRLRNRRLENVVGSGKTVIPNWAKGNIKATWKEHVINF